VSRPSLILAPGKDKAVLRRHPWIFSGAVRKRVGNPQEGDMVDVYGADGKWLAAGHFQDESIICKVLSFDTPDVDPEAHPEFWRERVHQAVEYRSRLGFFDLKETNVFRLVHAEGDYLPGLVADYYNGVLVLQAHSVGMHRTFPLLAQLFAEELPLKSIFDKSSTTIPGGGAEDGYIWGEEPKEWEICEDGNRLLINFFEGQKTGFFCRPAREPPSGFHPVARTASAELLWLHRRFQPWRVERWCQLCGDSGYKQESHRIVQPQCALELWYPGTP